MAQTVAQIAVLAGLVLLALGFALGGNNARACHIGATVAFGLALVTAVVGIS